MEYEDKGLSGYCSDRPDFQGMLHDIQEGKIRAIVCYKLDRIGRKTTDLLRLIDFLEKYNVDLLICSNEINTASDVSKIFIQIFAVAAEFERDTLTERITDNIMELAKGRWLGGNTPEPEDPDHPGSGENNTNNTNTSDEDSRVPHINLENIKDKDVPLEDLPENNLPEDDTTIDDGEVPLKPVPDTADMIPVTAMAAAALSLGGVVVLSRKRK